MNKYKRCGFTYLETIVVLGILSILFTLSFINVGRAQINANINQTLDVLISNIKQQQLKSMIGDTESRTNHDVYGVHFNGTSYVLFHGSTYNPADTSNITIPLNSGETFTNILFPSANIIFTYGTGEVSGFLNGSNSVTIFNTNSSERKTITINNLGAITNVN